MAKAKALFDFESGGPNELSFEAGELLTVVEQDIGGGWWEARNFRGNTGLIPISYVEVMSPGIKSPKQPAPPRPVPSAEASRRLSSNIASHQAEATQPQQPARMSSALPACNNNNIYSQSNDIDDWTDDEWDDYESEEMQKSPTSSQADDSSQSRPRLELTRSQRSSTSSTTLRHRFSKSASDAFLFDEMPNVPETEKIVVAQGTDGPIWLTDSDRMYTCVLSSPKLAKKFRGIKSYISYQVTPTFSNIQVTRRYKHFDWLQQRLSEKFTTVAIPPLPEKQIAGRFEDDFVSTRLKQLQLWIDRMCKHPVICHSDVFLHFLSCTDDKRWTAGKRKAEKDHFIGERLFFTVEPRVEPTRCPEAQVESFSRFVKGMDESVKQLYGMMERSAKKYEESFSRHYKKVGQSFCGLSRSFELDDRPVSRGLTAAVLNTSKAFEEVGDLYMKQPANDVSHMLDGLQEYKGILSTFPDIILLQRGIVTKLQDKEDSGKVDDDELHQAKCRSDVVTCCVMAESQHFHQQRLSDFRDYVRAYLNSQIEFHRMITSRLEAAAMEYDRL